MPRLDFTESSCDDKMRAIYGSVNSESPVALWETPVHVSDLTLNPTGNRVVGNLLRKYRPRIIGLYPEHSGGRSHRVDHDDVGRLMPFRGFSGESAGALAPS
jgi:hypothetical protein